MTSSQSQDAIKELKRRLPPEILREGLPEREEAASDRQVNFSSLPDLVVKARSREDVVELLRWSDQFNIPVTPRSGGTGMAGGSVPVQGGVVLDLSGMNRILELNPADMIARVEPGVINLELKRAAEALGLDYPPDPASNDESMLGGNAAVNAGGLSCVKYGVTRDYVLACEAVLVGGEVIHCGARTRKHAVGYNLAQLLVGSEGTLAVITELTLRLVPLMKERRTIMAFFPDEESASLAVISLTQKGITPRTVEILDREVLRLLREHGDLESASSSADALLLIECDGREIASVESESRLIVGVMKNAGAIEIKAAGTAEEAERLWSVRRAVSPALKEIALGKYNEDICVPRSKLPELFESVHSLASEYDLIIPSFGHAGDGNVHVNVMFRDSDEQKRAHRAVDELFDIVLSLGGTISGEHGIGLAKRDYFSKEIGPVERRLMKSIKSAFDPKGLLNPGKIF